MDEFPTVWNFEAPAGVPKDKMSLVWEKVIMQEGSTFWQTLPPIDKDKGVFSQLNHLSKSGHDIYFLTHRMGSQAKLQTEKFLYEQGIDYPTVLLSGNKFPLIQSLQLDVFIDDKLETINEVALEVVRYKMSTQVYLKDAPYNREGRQRGYKIVTSVIDMLNEEGLWGSK